MAENPIPPLMCSTPPPLDFGNDEPDDYDDQFDAYDEISQFPEDVYVNNKVEEDLKLPEEHLEPPPDLPIPKIPSPVPELSSQIPNHLEKSEVATIRDIIEDDDYVQGSFSISADDLEEAKEKREGDIKEEIDFNIQLDTPPSLSVEIPEIPSPNSSTEADINEEVDLPCPSLVLDAITPENASISDHVLEESSLKSIEKENIEEETEINYAKSEITTISEDIPKEKVPEIEKPLDNVEDPEDFDEFMDFERAQPNPVEPLTIPIFSQTPSVAEPFEFEADFSQFSAAFPEEPEPIPVIESKVEESEFKEQVKEQSFEAEDDEDDDFGDFTSSVPQTFEEIQTPIVEENIPSVEFDASQLDKVISCLFPNDEIGSEAEQNNLAVISESLRNDTLLKVDEFETTSLGMDYQWLKMDCYKSLVKAVGIDSRNILYGSKWNMSMPRFAANLGGSPLQPVKSGNVAGNSQPTLEGDNVSDEVPVAQFDWIGSGLVNPLDGSKTASSVQRPAVAAVDPAEQPPQYSVFEAEQRISSGPSPVNIDTATIVIVDRDELEPPVLESQTIAPIATFQNSLRETHIYTPSKEGAALGPEVQPEEAISVDSTHRIVVKEYRDVEYDPHQYISAMQSAISKESPIYGDNNDKEEILSNNSNTKTNHVDKNAFIENVLNDDKKKPDDKENEEEDDEFTDFQSVPVPEAKNNPLPLSVQSLPMLLMPKSSSFQTSPSHNSTNSQQGASLNTIASSILVPEVKSGLNQINSFGQIQWPDNSDKEIDKSELERIDEIFSKKQSQVGQKNQPAVQQSSKEEEWTDFISSEVKDTPRKNEDDDDWTDFVSGNAPQFQSKPPQFPNFAPWSSTSLPPPAGQFHQNHSVFQQPIHNQFNGTSFNYNNHNRPDLLPNTDFASAKPFFISTVSSGFNFNRVNQKK